MDVTVPGDGRSDDPVDPAYGVELALVGAADVVHDRLGVVGDRAPGARGRRTRARRGGLLAESDPYRRPAGVGEGDGPGRPAALFGVEGHPGGGDHVTGLQGQFHLGQLVGTGLDRTGRRRVPGRGGGEGVPAGAGDEECVAAVRGGLVVRGGRADGGGVGSGLVGHGRTVDGLTGVGVRDGSGEQCAGGGRARTDVDVVDLPQGRPAPLVVEADLDTGPVGGVRQRDGEMTARALRAVPLGGPRPAAVSGHIDVRGAGVGHQVSGVELELRCPAAQIHDRRHQGGVLAAGVVREGAAAAKLPSPPVRFGRFPGASNSQP